MSEVIERQVLDLISTNEAARICGTYRTTIWGWIKTGKLIPATVVEGKALLHRSDIEALAASRKAKPEVAA